MFIYINIDEHGKNKSLKYDKFMPFNNLKHFATFLWLQNNDGSK